MGLRLCHSSAFLCEGWVKKGEIFIFLGKRRRFQNQKENRNVNEDCPNHHQSQKQKVCKACLVENNIEQILRCSNLTNNFSPFHHSLKIQSPWKFQKHFFNGFTFPFHPCYIYLICIIRSLPSFRYILPQNLLFVQVDMVFCVWIIYLLINAKCRVH